MRLRYWSKHNVWFAEASFAEKDILKDAGFTWDRIVRKHWATHDVDVASRLARFGDAECQEAITKAKSERFESIHASMADDSNLHFPAPDGEAYRGFQKAGIEYMLAALGRGVGVLNGDDMGIGKTIQAIGVINANPEKFKHVLWITKAALKITVKRELQKWLVVPRHIEIVNGGEFPRAEVLIINHDITMKWYDYLRSEEWDLIIVDEAHMLGNPQSLRTRAVFGGKPIRKDPVQRTPLQSPGKICLTGTPIKNFIKELYGILHWLDPATWPSFQRYIREYSSITNNGWGNNYSGKDLPEEEKQKKAEALQKKLRSTIMIRRLKKDVLKELPEKRYQIIELPCPPEYRDLIQNQLIHYDAAKDFLARTKQRIEEAKIAGNKEEYEAALAQLKEGKRVAFKEMSEMRHNVACAKNELVKSFLKDTLAENGEKLLVFGHHRDCLEEIADAFKGQCVLVYGGQSDTARQASVDIFQSDPDCKVFVGSIRAAGEGLNITAAPHVVFSEFDWTPGQMDQAASRAHRMGQLGEVLVTYLVLEGSLDARQIEVFCEKGRVIGKAMDHEEVVLVGTEEKHENLEGKNNDNASW